MPISTIFDKIKKYDNDLIRKHTALLDFEALGYSTRANIMLKVEKSRREDFQSFIKKDHRVNSAYRINNGFDFIIEVISKDGRELQDFVEVLEEKFKVIEKEVFYIIDDVKREAFLSNPNGFMGLTIP
ncbi:Lrp/AsnC family transcriptional regulator [Acidobacteria bacterium AH-259-D05]|nr:Lrp/AsnC family transcriptional regulator [Acidobacteria bacterium AH-259-D05]